MTEKVLRFSFCPKCGGELALRPVRDCARLVCGHCSYVMYENPVVGVAVIHNPETHTVGIWFHAEIIGGFLHAGDDLDDVEWHSLDNVPPMAFPSDYTDEMLKNPCRCLAPGV